MTNKLVKPSMTLLIGLIGFYTVFRVMPPWNKSAFIHPALDITIGFLAALTFTTAGTVWLYVEVFE